MATKSSAADVVQEYIKILGRPPESQQALNHFMNKPIEAVRADLNWAIATGAENKDANQKATDAVTQAYEKTLGRAPDISGLGFYAAQVVSGQAKPTDIAAVLANSPEGMARAATTTTNTAEAEARTRTETAAAAGSNTGTAAVNTARAAAETAVRNAFREVLNRDPDANSLTF